MVSPNHNAPYTPTSLSTVQCFVVSVQVYIPSQQILRILYTRSFHIMKFMKLAEGSVYNMAIKIYFVAVEVKPFFMRKQNGVTDTKCYEKCGHIIITA